MRVVIQRVSDAQLTIDGSVFSQIGKGLMILAGFEDSDTVDDIKWIAKKITNLRIFDDENGNMNLSVDDIDGEIMLVSQFTLHAKTKKGNRPSFIKSAKPEVAEPLYNQLIQEFDEIRKNKTKTGKFGADMKINLTNTGPVTIFIDTKNKE